jgi:hypothetical protein
MLLIKELIKKKKPLFEAAFEFKNCFSKVDILVPNGKKWDIIEVKSGTKVKDINLYDVSFQKYIYESNGLDIRKCYLMYLNKEYVRKGNLNLKKLFVKDDITLEVRKLSRDIEERISSMFDIISSIITPQAGILQKNDIKEGNHNCLSEGCLDLPQNNVFNLYYDKKKGRDLYSKGIYAIKDIPADYKLNEKHTIQRNCAINNEIYIDKTKITDFLNNLEYPIYYLDFETIYTAIPMFSGLKPHDQLPFQFSLHVVKKNGEKSQHFEYLYNGCDDPRKEFLQELQQVLGSTGSIVVYNLSFEKKVLESLAKFQPEYSEWVEKIVHRLVDLYIPFRKFLYYNSKQQGKTSLKAVLPSITGKSYDELDIQEGMTASIEFHRVTYSECIEQEKQKVRTDLLKYCELDTLAQYEIIEKLKALIE